MAHLITRTDTMASAGNEKPWHYSETSDRVRLDPRESIPAAEIVKIAGLDWTVGLAPVFTRIGDQYVPVSGSMATYRSDLPADEAVLGLVSYDYAVVQNATLVDFLQALVDETDGRFETALSMRGGRDVVFLMRTPQYVRVGDIPGEEAGRYIAAYTSHDGSRGVGVKFTHVRIVCNNTFRLALGGAGAEFYTDHRGDVMSRIAEGRKAANLTLAGMTRAEDLMDQLSQQMVTADQAEAFFLALIPTPRTRKPEDAPAARAAAEAARSRVQQSWLTTGNLAPIRDTRYGLLQGVAQFDAHDRRFMGSPGQSRDERRAEVVLLERDSLTARAARILTGQPVSSNRTIAGQISGILTEAGW